MNCMMSDYFHIEGGKKTTAPIGIPTRPPPPPPRTTHTPAQLAQMQSVIDSTDDDLERRKAMCVVSLAQGVTVSKTSRDVGLRWQAVRKIDKSMDHVPLMAVVRA